MVAEDYIRQVVEGSVGQAEPILKYPREPHCQFPATRLNKACSSARLVLPRVSEFYTSLSTVRPVYNDISHDDIRLVTIFIRALVVDIVELSDVFSVYCYIMLRCTPIFRSRPCILGQLGLISPIDRLFAKSHRVSAADYVGWLAVRVRIRVSGYAESVSYAVP